MAERAPTPLGAPCPACPSAAASAGSGLLQCVCGTWHGADDARWPRDTPEPATGVRARPGLDAREVASPTRPPARLPRESFEVARTRRLLAALRPYGPGPDQDPSTTPPEGPGASMAPREGRAAPWEVTAPAGAFQRLSAPLAGAVVARIAHVNDPRVRATLEHLRVHGTLAHGYGALALGVARAIGEPARLVSWQRDTHHGWDRARVWGAAQIDRACDTWEATCS